MKRQKKSSNWAYDRTARGSHHNMQNILLYLGGEPIEFETRVSHQGCKTLPRKYSYNFLFIGVSYGRSGLTHVHHHLLLVTQLSTSEPFSNPVAGCQGVRFKSTLASPRSMRMPETRSTPPQSLPMTATHSLCTIADTVLAQPMPLETSRTRKMHRRS